MTQTTGHVLMIRPRRFGPNADTAVTNAFQQTVAESPAELNSLAVSEFDSMVARLLTAGVQPHVFEDTDSPAKPDAVFPNNWVSFHDNGDVILYPMHAPNRRPERRGDVIADLAERGGFRVDRIIDLSALERQGEFLEGTGSLVIDRTNGVAYAALSSRTHRRAIAEFSRKTGIEVIVFHTRDEQARPLYHTNVMLSIGRRSIVICADAILFDRERGDVLERLARTGRTIIQISLAQMRAFAANLLELATPHQRSVIVMSTTAGQALTEGQIGALGQGADLLQVPIATIERVGGGSVRCMLAEIFLTPGVVDADRG